MTFLPPEARLSEETRAAIRAAHGRESASKVALRLGVKRNTVLGTWGRMREQKKKAAEATAAALPARRLDRVVGLHGVSLPRLRCLEARHG